MTPNATGPTSQETQSVLRVNRLALIESSAAENTSLDQLVVPSSRLNGGAASKLTSRKVSKTSSKKRPSTKTSVKPSEPIIPEPETTDTNPYAKFNVPINSQTRAESLLTDSITSMSISELKVFESDVGLETEIRQVSQTSSSLKKEQIIAQSTIEERTGESSPLIIPIVQAKENSSPLQLPYVRLSSVLTVDNVPSTSHDNSQVLDSTTVKEASLAALGVTTGTADTIADVLKSVTRVVHDDIINPYPTVIKPAAHVTRVSLGSSLLYSRSPGSSPSGVTLTRPVTSSQNIKRYARSSTASSRSSQHSKNLSTKQDSLHTDASVMPANATLPFLKLTNALQLHLKLDMLGNSEIIHSWNPGSVIVQSQPFLSPSSTFQSSSFFSFPFLSTPKSPFEELKSNMSPIVPGYLLVTDMFLYIFQPSFDLVNPPISDIDDQTGYLNPSQLLRLINKISLSDIARIDIGAARQYLALRVTKPSEQKETLSTSKKRNTKMLIDTIVFLTRSKTATTQIIDFLKTEAHEHPERNTYIINQDVEYAIRNLQRSVLLRVGPKMTQLFSTNDAWSSEPFLDSIDEVETDDAVDFEVTKVDFEFIRLYSLGGLLRYTCDSSGTKSADVLPVTIAATKSYLYLLRERLDVWPPLIVPSEYSPHTGINESVENWIPHLQEASAAKGFTADLIPEYDHVYGLGRIRELISVERWRTWRIDSGLQQKNDPDTPFRGLGRFLQHGIFGAYQQSDSKKQLRNINGTTSGFLWWIRLIFGRHVPQEKQTTSESISLSPITPPNQIPVSSAKVHVSYWWDVCFTTRDAADDFIDGLRSACSQQFHSGWDTSYTPPDFIIGDD